MNSSRRVLPCRDRSMVNALWSIPHYAHTSKPLIASIARRFRPMAEHAAARYVARNEYATSIYAGLRRTTFWPRCGDGEYRRPPPQRRAPWLLALVRSTWKCRSSTSADRSSMRRDRECSTACSGMTTSPEVTPQQFACRPLRRSDMRLRPSCRSATTASKVRSCLLR